MCADIQYSLSVTTNTKHIVEERDQCKCSATSIDTHLHEDFKQQQVLQE
jgi:hypothetical protein